MASRTQLRLTQLTGSVDDTKSAAAAINETSVQGVLDHVAASIKRIHGGSGFQAQTAGHFNQNLHITGSGIDFNAASTLETAAGALTLKGASDLGLSAAANNDIIFQAGSTDVLTLGVTAAGDQTLITNIQDQDLIFQVNDGGSPTEVMRLDGDVSALAMASGKEIRFGGANTTISGDGLGLTIAGGTNGVSITGVGGLNTSGQATNITVIDNNANALSFDASGQADILRIDSTNSAEKVVALKLDVTNDLSVGGDVTITGDLTVNGTQTVLDTTSLVIEDSVIALSSGSAANADVNAAVIFQRSTANLGGDGDKTNGALMFLQGTGFKLGYTSDTAETAQGSLAVADDDLGELYVGQLSVGGASDNIAISGGALAATSAGDFKVDAATDIILDADGADIFFDDGGTRFGGISMNAGGNTLILSSSAGNSITLSSQTSQILLMDSTFSGLTLDIATANQLQFLDRDDRLRLNFESAGGNDQVLVSGSLKLDNGADPAQLVFKEASPNGTNTLTLDVPAAIGSSYTLTLPASNGTSGQVLKLADGNGNLEFGSAVGDLARSAYKVTAQITPADLDFSSSGNVSLLSAAGYTALNITKSAADLPKALEVFVNGQLLVSGSDGGGDTDYTHKGSTTLKFAFNLEADDIVQIIQR